jgi:mono/diheme cytochrome c family protein
MAADPPPAAAPEEPAPSEIALLFGKRCGGCHALGQGDRAGPDLVGVLDRRERAWLSSFIRAPGTAIDRGDPVANELLAKFKGVRMPDQALGDDELAALFEYLDQCTKKGGCALALGKTKKASEATPEEIAIGREFFEGSRSFANGGAPCLSCHNVRGIGLLGGGTLAQDLTFAFARLGEVGTTSALASTPFPLMKDVYGKRPLQDAEAFAVKAFLSEAARDGTPPSEDHGFLYLGVVGLGLSLLTVGAAGSHRLDGVRRSIVHRGDS